MRDIIFEALDEYRQYAGVNMDKEFAELARLRGVNASQELQDAAFGGVKTKEPASGRGVYPVGLNFRVFFSDEDGCWVAKAFPRSDWPSSWNVFASGHGDTPDQAMHECTESCKLVISTITRVPK